MAEHKGLRANFLAFKKNMDDLNTAITKGNEIAPVMTADITSMVEQVTSYQDDLKFMGQVLGNSGSSSDTVQDTQTTAEQVSEAPAAKTNISPETHTRDSQGHLQAVVR